MKLLLLGLSLFSSMSFADPFFGDVLNELSTPKNELAKNTQNQTACSPVESVNKIQLEDKLSQLHFIGVVRKADDYSALFINTKNQIIDLHINDLIENEHIQIKAIDMKSVSYIQWNTVQQCNEPSVTLLKL